MFRAILLLIIRSFQTVSSHSAMTAAGNDKRE